MNTNIDYNNAPMMDLIDYNDMFSRSVFQLISIYFDK